MSAKFYRRGAREYYQVTAGSIMRIVNKEVMNEVTIVQLKESGPLKKQYLTLFMSDIDEAKEISREEFKEQFEVASRLIVLEP